MNFLWNSIIFLIGFAFGSISFSIIFSKKIHHEDVRIHGSGNAGATNTTRNYGFKEGFTVFVLDTLKVLSSTIVAWFIAKEAWFGNDAIIIVQIAPFGAFIGHIYPIWHRFKGGKGVSCFFGFIVSFNIVLAVIVVVTFLFIVNVWKMVSLASVIMPAVIFCFSWIPWFQTGELTWFFNDSAWWISSFFVCLMAGIIVLKHIPNIKRILAEQETTINQILKK